MIVLIYLAKILASDLTSLDLTPSSVLQYVDDLLLCSPSLSTLNSQLAVYPNPSRNIINIDGIEIGAHIDIYTLQGQLIHTTTTTKIDISNFDSGIYIIKSGNKTTKLIKQ